MGWSVSKRQSSLALDHGNRETLWPRQHTGSQASHRAGQLSAPIAPAPAHQRGSRRAEQPSIPPRARTATPGAADRASADHRTAPSAAIPGWLAVGNTGDRKATGTALRASCRSSATVCAEPVRPGRPPRRGRPARTCVPPPSAAASRSSPATDKTIARRRHSAATLRPSSARSTTPSCRYTTPERPRGRRAMAGSRSGRRAASLNSQSTG
jgi:hypothetical protein